MTVLVSFLALVVVVSGFHSPKDNLFLEYLKSRLKKYNSSFPLERTYILTDRFVYKPGEDMWFRGFVSSSGGNQNELNSEDLFIKLLNSRGEEIISRRYPVSGNQCSGRLLIPRTSIPGRYWLVAYTGWMKNQCPQEAYRKEILVSKYFDKRFQVEILYDKVSYDPNDTMNASIRIIDPMGNPVPEISYEYTIGSFDRREVKGSGETNVKGYSKITCIVPESTEILLLTVDIRSRKLSGDYSLIIPAITTPPEISFFPEGGRLIKGLSSTLAIRATMDLGQPIGISGEIVDAEGIKLQSVSTDSRGTGKFVYTPGEDTCYLQFTYPSGTARKIPLPAAADNGCIIHCDKQDGDSVRFRINSSDQDSTIISYWVASLDHNIIWNGEVQFKRTATVSIPVKNLKRGIMQVSVFDQKKALIAERLVKIQHPENTLVVKTDHKVYRSRQRVNLSLEFKGRSDKMDVAMLVSLRHLSFNPLVANLYDVAGFLPCDSLKVNNLDQITDLDLLITAYRFIKWDDVLAEDKENRSFIRMDGITGSVIDKKDNLSPHAKVRVTHIPNYKFYETQTDENGKFQVLFGSDIIDFNYLNVDAYDAMGKVNLAATIDQEYAKSLWKGMIMEGENSDSQKVLDVTSYGEPDLVYALRYGPGKFRKSVSETRKKYDPIQYAGYSSVLDILQDIKPYSLVNNTIVFTAENEPGLVPVTQEGAIIVINGALKGNKVDILRNLLPSDITNINISTSLVDVHKYTPVNFQGVIEITTIQGMFKYRQPTVQLGMDILNSNRMFYSPDYSVESTTSGDNRKTLFWSPKLSLYTEQSALVSFYTSDIKGIYYGLVEGLDGSGNPVRAEFSFVVE